MTEGRTRLADGRLLALYKYLIVLKTLELLAGRKGASSRFRPMPGRKRQWSDLAIARTTPVLMALFSLVCLMVHRLREHWPTLARSSAWSLKPEATFSDGLALVRRRIWGETYFDRSAGEQDPITTSPQRLERLLDQIAATA